MKKYLTILLSLVMLTSLVSCIDGNKSSSESPDSVSESVTEEATTEPASEESTATTQTTAETTTTKATTKATTTTTTTVTTTVTTTLTTTETTQPPTEPPTPPPTQPPTNPPTQPPVPKTIHFILNTDSNCVHSKESCTAAQKILPENRAEIDIPEDEIGNYYNVYWACGKCSKAYSNELPKFD